MKRLLVLLLAVFVLFAGCAAGGQSGAVVSSSVFGDVSSLPSSGGQGSSSVSQSKATTSIPIQQEEEVETEPLTEEKISAYLPVTQGDKLLGDWRYDIPIDLLPAIVSADVYYIRIEETDITLGIGPKDSNAGIFFKGEYQLGTDGILYATLREQSWDEEDGTGNLCYISMIAQQSESTDEMLFTLRYYNTVTAGFETFFTPMNNEPMLFYRLKI